MNSKQLKSSHKKIYEEFFQKNQIVVSAPFLMTWAGDPSKYYSGITIKQKIPLRLYLGISPNKSWKVQLKWITYFDKMSDGFVYSNILEYAPHFYQLNDYLKKTKKLLWPSEWIDINILSELPRWIGLGFESIISFSLSTLLHRLSWNIDHTSVEHVNNISIEQALKESDTKISKWLTDGIIFDKLIFGTIISGTKRSSFFHSHYPIVTLTNDYGNTEEDAEFSVNSSFTFRFNELFSNLKTIPFLPLDYGIIYSGKPILMEQIITKNKQDSLYIHQIKPELKNIFSKYFPKNNKQTPKFYTKFIDTDTDTIEKSLYWDIMWLISIKTLYFMSKLYETEYSEEYIKHFIDMLKKFRRWDYITKESSGMFMEIIKKLTENFSTTHQLLSLFPSDTSIMWWTIWFALPLEWYRKHILQSVTETQEEFAGVDLIYCSWMDGTENEGLKFEQDIEKWLFSEFLDSQKHSLRNINWDNIIGNYSDLLMTCEHDILLDCTSNKLYIKWKKATSEELHSQTTTIEVLQILIQNIGKDIHSTQLPISSYSKNKNEMLWKIIIPLMKLTKKKLDKELPLVCKGMLCDFYIKLQHNDIKIWILDKIYKF